MNECYKSDTPLYRAECAPFGRTRLFLFFNCLSIHIALDDERRDHHVVL